MARGKLTAQLVGMTFIMGGAQGLQDLETRLCETASENVLKKACDVIRENGGNPDSLREVLEERFPQSEGGQRGRKAVQVGETRTYKTSDNGVISVSAKAWGFNPGDEITVTYTENGFEIAS